MPATNKEAVLSLVWTALQTVPDVTTRVRNRGLLDNEQRPALVMMDGDVSEGLSPPRNGRGASQVVLATTKVLRPQIFVLLKTIKPRNEEIAEILAPYEKEVTSRVLTNAPLRALLGSNGGLSYAGSETDLKSGAEMAGQIRFDFSITFVFDPRL